MSDKVNILNGGTEIEISLDEILDFDVSDVEIAFGGFSITPPSIALWKVINMEIKTFGEHTVVKIECECEKCYMVKSESKDENSMVGEKHSESIFIKDVAEDLAKVKGFLERIGMTNIAKLSDALEAATGYSFVASIKHTRNKNDPDNPFVNMDIKGILSQEVYEKTVA
jgi:hypothetical protein